MRKLRVMRVAATIATLFLMAAGPAVCQSVAGAVICQSVSPKGQPISPDTWFPGGADSLTVWFRAEDLPQDAKLHVQWTLQGVPLARHEATLQEGGLGWDRYAVGADQPLPDGVYEALITAGDAVLGRAAATVGGKRSEAGDALAVVPAPTPRPARPTGLARARRSPGSQPPPSSASEPSAPEPTSPGAQAPIPAPPPTDAQTLAPLVPSQPAAAPIAPGPGTPSPASEFLPAPPMVAVAPALATPSAVSSPPPSPPPPVALPAPVAVPEVLGASPVPEVGGTADTDLRPVETLAGLASALAAAMAPADSMSGATQGPAPLGSLPSDQGTGEPTADATLQPPAVSSEAAALPRPTEAASVLPTGASALALRTAQPTATPSPRTSATARMAPEAVNRSAAVRLASPPSSAALPPAKSPQTPEPFSSAPRLSRREAASAEIVPVVLERPARRPPSGESRTPVLVTAAAQQPTLSRPRAGAPKARPAGEAASPGLSLITTMASGGARTLGSVAVLRPPDAASLGAHPTPTPVAEAEQPLGGAEEAIPEQPETGTPSGEASARAAGAAVSAGILGPRGLPSVPSLPTALMPSGETYPTSGPQATAEPQEPAAAETMPLADVGAAAGGSSSPTPAGGIAPSAAQPELPAPAELRGPLTADAIAEDLPPIELPADAVKLYSLELVPVAQPAGIQPLWMVRAPDGRLWPTERPSQFGLWAGEAPDPLPADLALYSDHIDGVVPIYEIPLGEARLLAAHEHRWGLLYVSREIFDQRRRAWQERPRSWRWMWFVRQLDVDKGDVVVGCVTELTRSRRVPEGYQSAVSEELVLLDQNGSRVPASRPSADLLRQVAAGLGETAKGLAGEDAPTLSAALAQRGIAALTAWRVPTKGRYQVWVALGLDKCRARCHVWTTAGK